jgi:hypothetical protein
VNLPHAATATLDIPLLVSLDAAYADFPRELWAGKVMAYLRGDAVDAVLTHTKLKLTLGRGSGARTFVVTIDEIPSVRLPVGYDGGAIFVKPTGMDFGVGLTLEVSRAELAA